MSIRRIAAASIAALFAVTAASTEDWQPLVGVEVLRKLISGATAEIDIKEGVTAAAEYYADGAATVAA